MHRRIFFALLSCLAVGCEESPPDYIPAPTREEIEAASPDAVPVHSYNAPAMKWFEGGTLHQASALEWQKADQRNKLATCADIIAMLWKTDRLKPELANEIHSVDDMRPLAEELLVCLDKAMEPLPDAEQNRKAYTNQTVAGMATLGVVIMGWVEN